MNDVIVPIHAHKDISGYTVLLMLMNDVIVSIHAHKDISGYIVYAY